MLDSVLQKSPEKLYREPSGLSDGSQKHFSPTVGAFEYTANNSIMKIFDKFMVCILTDCKEKQPRQICNAGNVQTRR